MNKKSPGKVKDGQFIPNDLIAQAMVLAEFEGQDCDFVLQKKEGSKVKQYRYLYKVVYPLISEHTGHNQAKVDYLMKIMFDFEVIVFNGVEVRVPNSKKDFLKSRFTLYIENVRNWAMEFLGVRIPEPHEVGLG